MLRALLLAVLLALGPTAAAAAAVATPSAGSAYGRYQAQEAVVSRIAAQVAAADAAIVRAQSDLAALTAQAAASRAQLAGLQGQATALSAEVAGQRGRVDAAVRFLYEDGTVSFLDVLMQATSFRDFLSRFVLVTQLVSSEVGLLREQAAARTALAKQQAAVAVASARLARETEAQAAALGQLQRDQAARQKAMAAARQQAGAAASGLVALDQALLRGLPALNRALGEWSQLPWETVQPADVSVDLAAADVAVTLSATGLNAAVSLAPLALAIAPGGVSLAAPDMQLSGPVSIQGGDLLWQPNQLAVGGAPAGPGVLPALLAGRKLVIPVPPPAPGLRLQAVHLGNGSLELDFGL